MGKNEIKILEKTVDASIFFEKKDASKEILEYIKKEVNSVVPEGVETAKGRKAIINLASKVAKSKVALDNVGKELVSEQKELIKLVDAERKAIRDELDKLKEEVRRPVTEWEEEQKRLAALFDEEVARLKRVALVTEESNSISITAKINALKTYTPPSEIPDKAEELKEVRDMLIQALEQRYKIEKSNEVAREVQNMNSIYMESMQTKCTQEMKKAYEKIEAIACDDEAFTNARELTLKTISENIKSQEEKERIEAENEKLRLQKEAQEKADQEAKEKEKAQQEQFNKSRDIIQKVRNLAPKNTSIEIQLQVDQVLKYEYPVVSELREDFDNACSEKAKSLQEELNRVKELEEREAALQKEEAEKKRQQEIKEAQEKAEKEAEVNIKAAQEAAAVKRRQERAIRGHGFRSEHRNKITNQALLDLQSEFQNDDVNELHLRKFVNLVANNKIRNITINY